MATVLAAIEPVARQRTGGEPCLCCGQQLENKTAEEDFWLSPAPRHQPETIPGSVAGGGGGVALLSAQPITSQNFNCRLGGQQQAAAGPGSDIMGQRSDQ